MHGPTCIFWANLTPFSLQSSDTWVGDYSMFEYSEKMAGYVFFVPTDFDDSSAVLNISQLSSYLWVDEKTRSVDVVFVVYNGNFSRGL